MNYVVWLVTAIHLLSVVLWVGGMAFIMLVLRSGLLTIEPTTRVKVQGALFRRFFRTVWHVMPIAVISGLLLLILSYNHQPMPWPVMVMQTGGILMAAIFVGMFMVPNRRLQAKLADGTATAEDLVPVRRLVLLNLAIGTIILICVASL